MSERHHEPGYLKGPKRATASQPEATPPTSGETTTGLAYLEELAKSQSAEESLSQIAAHLDTLCDLASGIRDVLYEMVYKHSAPRG